MRCMLGDPAESLYCDPNERLPDTWTELDRTADGIRPKVRAASCYCGLLSQVLKDDPNLLNHRDATLLARCLTSPAELRGTFDEEGDRDLYKVWRFYASVGAEQLLDLQDGTDDDEDLEDMLKDFIAQEEQRKSAQEVIPQYVEEQVQAAEEATEEGAE